MARHRIQQGSGIVPAKDHLAVGGMEEAFSGGAVAEAQERIEVTLHVEQRDALRRAMEEEGYEQRPEEASDVKQGGVEQSKESERDSSNQKVFYLDHPRNVLNWLAKDIQDPANAHWLE